MAITLQFPYTQSFLSSFLKTVTRVRERVTCFVYSIDQAVQARDGWWTAWSDQREEKWCVLPQGLLANMPQLLGNRVLSHHGRCSRLSGGICFQTQQHWRWIREHCRWFQMYLIHFSKPVGKGWALPRSWLPVRYLGRCCSGTGRGALHVESVHQGGCSRLPVSLPSCIMNRPPHSLPTTACPV